MTDHDDAAFTRLRAADPAHGSSPVDLARLRAAVDARIAAEAGGEGGAAVTDITRPSRRHRWLRFTAAAAAVVAVGGVGFGLGRGTSGEQYSAAPAITLDGGAADSAGPQGEPAPGTGAGAALEDARMMWPGPSYRTTFRAEGLADEPGVATTWAFDVASVFTADRVAEVAAVLGLAGEPELRDGVWQVGATDGTGPYLMMYPDGQGNVNFYDPAKDPWNCVTAETLPAPDAGSGATDSGGKAVPGSGGCPRDDLGDAPGDAEAVALTRELLGKLGLDVDAFEYEVSKDEGAGWISVTAHQVVEGQRSGVAWFVNLSGAGVQSVSGSLAPLVSLGEYDVVSATDAVSRITDPRFGIIGGWSLLEMARGPVDSAVNDTAVSSTPSWEPPVTPSAGARIAWPVEEVAITGARLGVAQYTAPDGVAYLVPAWELSADDGRVWSVIAVTEEALDMAL